MLYTNLKHLETAADHAKVINENENVMVICGRMGPMCIPVYSIAEILEAKYSHVKFYDMEFDIDALKAQWKDRPAPAATEIPEDSDRIKNLRHVHSH